MGKKPQNYTAVRVGMFFVAYESFFYPCLHPLRNISFETTNTESPFFEIEE